MGAFYTGLGGPIYLARVLVCWSGPEIRWADFEIIEIYLDEFGIYSPGGDCTGDGCCCATSNDSNRSAKRRAPPKAGLLLSVLERGVQSPMHGFK